MRKRLVVNCRGWSGVTEGAVQQQRQMGDDAATSAQSSAQCPQLARNESRQRSHLEQLSEARKRQVRKTRTSEAMQQ